MRESDESLSALIATIARGSIEATRNNKIATVLAVIVLVGTTVAAVGSQYDERPRYRVETLPEILRHEGRFLDALRQAESAENEDHRIFYFVDAQMKAREALALIRKRYPQSGAGVRAHRQLIRYYELIDEDFAIIRTQMSLDPKVDFLAEWRQVQALREPLHEKWSKWIGG